MKKKSFFIFIILLYTLKIGANDINVKAKILDNKVRTGGHVSYEISVEYTDNPIIEDPVIGNIPGLSLINKQTGHQTQTIIANGKVETTKIKTYTYTFGTSTEGKFTIPQYSITVNGSVYKTEELKVVVSDDAPRKRRRGFGQLFHPGFFDDGIFSDFFNRDIEIQKDDIFIKAVSDKTTTYLGERVQVAWYLYTRHDIYNVDHLKHPILSNFWKEDVSIPTQLNFSTEIFNNKQYRKALLFKYDLFPLKSSELTIDTYKARYNLLPGDTNEYVRESNQIKINVLPLPQEGRPDNFTNAVGEYSVHLKRLPSQVDTNTPFNYTIVVEGYGNTKKLTLPNIDFQQFEVYDIVENSHYETKEPNQGKGYKEFDHLLIAKKAGTLTLPELKFSFFNPAKKQYITQTIPSIELNSTGEDWSLNQQNIKLEDNILIETTFEKNWISNKTVALWLTAFLLIFMTVRYFSLEKKPAALTAVEKIEALKTLQDANKVSLTALSIITDLLENLTQSKKSTNSELIELIPISKKDLKPEFEQLNTFFEEVAFSKEKNKNLDKYVDLLDNLARRI